MGEFDKVVDCRDCSCKDGDFCVNFGSLNSYYVRRCELFIGNKPTLPPTATELKAELKEIKKQKENSAPDLTKEEEREELLRMAMNANKENKRLKKMVDFVSKKNEEYQKTIEKDAELLTDMTLELIKLKNENTHLKANAERKQLNIIIDKLGGIK